MDITEVILHQHGEQRRMFSMLDEWPKDDAEGLAAVWNRLEILLETHAEGEETFFYPKLLKVGEGHADADSAGDEVEDSVKDHNEIRNAIKRVRATEPGSDEWWQAVTDCRVENDGHMAEEERRDLADFRLNASRDERHQIAVDFLRFESQKAAGGVELENHDPEQYVEEHS